MHGGRSTKKGSFESTLDWIYESQGDYQGCHMINNAAVTILGLVDGEVQMAEISKTAQRTQLLAEQSLTAGLYKNSPSPNSFLIEEW
jgi:hypothetical protein